MAEGQAGATRSQRAGRYITQPTGYRAFEPAPLPPQPALELDGELQRLLSSADRALGRLDGSVLTLPNPDLFVFMYVRKEAVLSSQIEGTQSSLQDLLSAEAKMFDESLPSDVDEVINYVRAMNHGLSRLAKLPVSVRLIREIHAELMQGAQADGCNPATAHQPELDRSGGLHAGHGFVRAAAASRGARGAWRAGSSAPTTTLCRRWVEIALAHVQFETIHPFLTGTARWPPADHLPADRKRRAAQAGAVSVALLQATPEEYYDHLQSVREGAGRTGSRSSCAASVRGG